MKFFTPISSLRAETLGEVEVWLGSGQSTRNMSHLATRRRRAAPCARAVRLRHRFAPVLRLHCRRPCPS